MEEKCNSFTAFDCLNLSASAFANKFGARNLNAWEDMNYNNPDLYSILLHIKQFLEFMKSDSDEHLNSLDDLRDNVPEERYKVVYSTIQSKYAWANMVLEKILSFEDYAENYKFRILDET